MSQRRYAANHFASSRWVASCELRRATCNPRRMPALDPLPGGQPAFCEPQSASCRPSARCTSQIAARRIDARHVRMVSTELLGLAANPRAAIREPQSASCGPVASRSSQIAARSIEARHVLRHDCSSQSTARSSQTVAQAVPFLRSQRAPRSSQGADFCAGGPRLTLFSSRRIADRTVADRSTLARRSRLTLFSSRRIADRTVAQSQIAALWPGGQGRGQLWFALSQFAGRKVQEFEQEGLSSRGQIACLQGAGCMKCPRSGVVSGGLHI